MYERILVPLDGSMEAEQVLPHVIELAERFRSTVRLIRATTPTHELAKESVTTEAPQLGMDIAKDRQAGEAAAAQAYLESVGQQRLAPAGIAYEMGVAPGPAASVILEEADNWSPGLLAMTTHGRGGVSRLIFGSVADAIVRESPVPILLVRIS